MNRQLPFYLALAGAWLLLAASPSYAQSQPYRFDLKAEKLDVPAGPWQVTRVLDLRADRSRLGSVHRGIANEMASADFTQPLAPELLQFIQAHRPPQPGARPVVMRVLTLALSEDLRTTSEHAEAELIADFLEPQADSTFRVLLTVGEVARRGGVDVTKFHPANVALTVQQALHQLAALSPAVATGETLSRADVLAGRGGAAAQRFAIQTASTPKRGFYRSFQEFRNNTPSESKYPFVIEHVAHAGKRWAGSDEVHAYYLQTDVAHPRRLVYVDNLWGLSDGKETLIVYRGRFHKLMPAPDGRGYTFIGPPVFDAQASNNVAAGAVLGGIVGAAIAGAANGAAPMDLYELHLASGRVVPAQEAGQAGTNGSATAPDSARVYVYRRFDSPKEQLVSLSATDQPTTVLHARQWRSLIWRDRRRDLKICIQVGSGPENCREFVPDFSQPTYLECTVPPNGGAAVLRPVPANEGLFELRRIQRLAKAGK